MMYFICRLDAIKGVLAGVIVLSIALMAASVVLNIFAGYTVSRRPLDESAKRNYHCMKKYAIICLITALILLVVNVLLPTTKEAKDMIESKQYETTDSN